VAKEYRDQLAADVQLKGKPFYSGKTGKQTATTGNQELDDYLLANLGDVSAARSNLLADLRDVRLSGGDVKDYQKTLADLRNIRGDVETGNTGHLYNVELKWPDAAREAADPLGEHHLLDWDAPVTAESDIGKRLKGLFPQYYQQIMQKDIGGNHPTGDMVYNRLSELMSEGKRSNVFENAASYGAKNASQELSDLGIPGIRYLDQGSRSAGTGSRNYVMFDDQFPNIVSRNGVSLSDLLRR